MRADQEGYPEHGNLVEPLGRQSLPMPTRWVRFDKDCRPGLPTKKIVPPSRICSYQSEGNMLRSLIGSRSRKKGFGQQTPRRWGWRTPLKKRSATRTNGDFMNHARNVNSACLRFGECLRPTQMTKRS